MNYICDYGCHGRMSWQRMTLFVMFLMTCYIFINYKYEREEIVNHTGREVDILSGNRPQMKNICVPKYNIVYAKLAKTGSTTLQNILARKAFNNRIFAGASQHRRPPNASKHIICYGMKQFIYKKLSAMVPPDAVYISMFREPVKHFESTFYYFRSIVPAFQKADSDSPMQEYLENAHKYHISSKDKGRWWAAKNAMFYELGYDPFNENLEYIQKAINELDKELDFVMLTEHYDISLLLLQDFLCWEMEDIVYLTLNAREQSVDKPLDPKLNELVYKWNKADTALHKHFNSTFWRQVDQYGRDRLKKNLEKFRNMKENLYNNCVQEKTVVTGDQSKIKYKLRKSVENEICKQVAMDESSWLRVLLKRTNFI